MPKRTKIPGYRNLFFIDGAPSVYLIESFPGLGEVVRSTRQREPKAAERKAKELVREILKQDPNYKPVTVAEVAREYMEVMASELRGSTIESTFALIENRIIRHLGHVNLDGPLRAEWAKFATKFYAGELDLTTDRTKFRSGANHSQGRFLFNTRKALVSILNYAREEGYITRLGSEPTGRAGKRRRKLFPINDPPSREGLVIPPEHMELFFTVPFRMPTAQYFRLICRTGYFMGTRLLEMVGLERERTDLQKPSLLFRPEDVKTGSKTGEGREIAIAPEVLRELECWLSTHESEYVFPAARGCAGHLSTDGFRTIWVRTVKRIRAALNVEWEARSRGESTEILRAISEGVASPFEKAIDRALRVHGNAFPDYNPNDMRHSFFTVKLLVEEQNLSKVAIYGGTSEQMLRERYIHDKFKNTRGVVERAPRAVADWGTGVLPGLETFWSESPDFVPANGRRLVSLPRFPRVRREVAALSQSSEIVGKSPSEASRCQ